MEASCLNEEETDMKHLKIANMVLNDLYKMADQSHPWLKEWIDRRFAEYMVEDLVIDIGRVQKLMEEKE